MPTDTNRRRRRLRLPSAGTVMGGAALIIALAGPAQALPGLNTVFSDDIVNGEVKTADIGNNEVKTADIAADAVRQADIASDAVGADELENTWIVGSGSAVNSGQPGTATATCPAGYQVISGGFTWDVNNSGLQITSMELNTGANSVEVSGFNGTGGNRTLSARAYCIPQ